MNKPQHTTIAELFRGRPRSLSLYEQIKKRIENIGPVKIEVFRTQVSFAAGRKKFAWVWLPQMWFKKRHEGSVALTLKTPEPIPSSRFAEVTNTRPGNWTHHLIIENASDIDEQVMGWLRHEYQRTMDTKPTK